MKSSGSPAGEARYRAPTALSRDLLRHSNQCQRNSEVGGGKGKSRLSSLRSSAKEKLIHSGRGVFFDVPAAFVMPETGAPADKR